jgi:hypothetical protein
MDKTVLALFLNSHKKKQIVRPIIYKSNSNNNSPIRDLRNNSESFLCSQLLTKSDLIRLICYYVNELITASIKNNFNWENMIFPAISKKSTEYPVCSRCSGWITPILLINKISNILLCDKCYLKLKNSCAVLIRQIINAKLMIMSVNELPNDILKFIYELYYKVVIFVMPTSGEYELFIKRCS